MSAWEEKHVMGKVLYEFKAGGQFQIDLAAGETVEVLKQSSGWYRGRVVGRDSKGIFPITFVQIMPDEPFPNANTSGTGGATAAASAASRSAPSPSSAVSPPSAAATATAAPVASASSPVVVTSSVASNPFKRADQAAAAAAAAAGGASHSPISAARKWPPAAADSTSIQPAKQTDTPASVPSRALPSPVANGATTAGSPAPSRPPPPLQTQSSMSAIASQTHMSVSTPSSSVVGRGVSGTIVGGGPGGDSIPLEPEQKLQASMSLESLLVEVDHTVREWSASMRTAMALGNSDEYHRGMERLSSLLESRRRLVAAAQAQAQGPQSPSASDESTRASIRHEMIEMIEGSRKMAEGYMVPRNPAGAVADSANTGVVELLALHRSMYSALKEESAAVWIAKGHARRVASFRKQEIEQARSNQQTAVTQGAAPGAAGGTTVGNVGAVSQTPLSPSASHVQSFSSPSAAPMSPSSSNPSGSGAISGGGSGSGSAVDASGLRPSGPSSGSSKKFPAGPLQLYLNVKMCVAGDMLVSLPDGTSRQLQSCHVPSVLSYNPGSAAQVPRMVEAPQGAEEPGPIDQGERACMELTFEDGRKLVCTPDHRVLTNAGWRQAQELTPADEVIVGTRGPSFEASPEDAWWSLDVTTHANKPALAYKLNLTTRWRETVAFARLLGYLLTDGALSAQPQATWYAGHELDAKQMADDIRLLTGVAATVSKTPNANNTWQITAPLALTRAFLAVGVTVGDRRRLAHAFPAFLLQADGAGRKCPLAVVRAFLSGLFGGDGGTLSLMHHGGTLTGLSWSVACKGSAAAGIAAAVKPALTDMLMRAGIPEEFLTWRLPDTHASVPTAGGRAELARRKEQGEKLVDGVDLATVDPNATVSFVLNLGRDAVPIFHRNVNFAYCAHKHALLEAAAIAINIQDAALAHRKLVVEAFDELPSESYEARLAQAKQDVAQALGHALHPLAREWTPADQNLAMFDTQLAAHLVAWTQAHGVARDQNLPVFRIKLAGSKMLPGTRRVYDLTVRLEEGDNDDDKRVFFAAGVAVHNCIFSVGEATDLLFSLYSAREARFVTEEYSLALSDQGLPLNLALLHKMRTVFTDLSAADFEQDLWLVCRIYRRGRLVFDTAKAKAPSRLYRRPFGCAACSLTESNIDAMVGREYEPPNAAMTIYTCSDESKFSRLHEMIVAREHRSLEPAPRAKGIALGLVLYTGELDAVRKANADTMDADSCPVSRKLCFPARMPPGDARNDLYVHLLGSSFQQDNKKTAKNIEMALRVVCDDGTSVENCISHGSADSSPQTEYHSAVYYHLNTPFYNETVRLSVPDHLIERCHLFASFWHVSTSKKISCFSFAFLPITTKHGSIVLDAEYKLTTFKPFPKIEAGPAGAGSCFYLAGDNAKPKLEPRKEFLIVRTQSLSTVQTQNLVLHNVFKHARADPTAIRGLMERFVAAMTRDNLAELARFLRETLNTLFTMLYTPAYARDSDAIFRAILHALTLLGDPTHTLPGGVACAGLLDEYVATLFTNPKHAFAFGSLHPTLVRLTTYMLQQASAMAVPNRAAAVGGPPPPPQTSATVAASDALLKLSKSLHYVFQLILRSREIEVRAGTATAPKDHDAFKRSLVDLLQHVNRLVAADSRDDTAAATSAQQQQQHQAGSAPVPIASPSPSPLLSAQSFVVHSFPQAIGDLLGIFTPSELAGMARDLILSVPVHGTSRSVSTLDSAQNINKLLLIRSILSSPLGAHAAARSILYPVAISALRVHLMAIGAGGLAEPYVCIDILNHMLGVVSKMQFEATAAAAAAAAGNTDVKPDTSMVQQFVPLLQPIVHVALAIQQNALAGATGTAVSSVGGAAADGLALAPQASAALRPPSDSVLQLIHIDVSVDSITVLWTLLSLLSGEQIESFIGSLSHSAPSSPSSSSHRDRSELLSFLVDFLSVCSNSLQSRCYPDMWIVMNMVECSLMTKMLEHMSKPIRAHCIRPAQVAATVDAAVVSASTSAPLSPLTPEQQVLRSYFSLVLDMLMYDQLQVELFPPRKKLFVLSRYGDVRAAIIQHFNAVWEALGEQKMDYIDQFLIVKLFDLARGGVQPPAPAHEFDRQTAAGAAVATDGAPTPKAAASLPLVKNPADEGHASREFALNVYFDMIASSYAIQQARGSGSGGVSGGDLFSQVERHTIDALYSLANLNQDAGRTLMSLLYGALSSRFESCVSSSAGLRSSGLEYLHHIARMYELMSSLLQFADTPLFEDERTSVALKLMHYLESTSKGQRKEMYSKYVQYLVDLHLSLKNYTEAGCTSMQAIRMLAWSDAPLPALDSTLTSYPAERERERKEKLYSAAIGYFRAGEDWERAIAYGEELRLYYQFGAFDFLKLSNLLQEQSECFRSIVVTERFYSNYFRVVYFGSGFDEELTGGADASKGVGKEFVYRGVKLESISDFTGRIKRKWPDAKILMSSDRPADDMMAAHKQIISITTLTRATQAEAKETMAALGIERSSISESGTTVGAGACSGAVAASLLALGGGGVPSSKAHADPPKNVLIYRDHNDLSVFVYAKGNQKDKKHPNEFRHLWVSKSFIVTAEAFPSNRRRQEVVARLETSLSPILNAIATMRAKNAELREKVAVVAGAPPGPVDIGPLSMNLNGMIDAAVNGGTQKYIEAFLSQQYLDENADERDLAVAQQGDLKASIVEQIADLKVALDLFGVRCDEKLRGLYDHLTGFYEQMKVKTQGVLV